MIMSLEDEYDLSEEVRERERNGRKDGTDRKMTDVTFCLLTKRLTDKQKLFFKVFFNASVFFQFDRCSHFFQMKNISFCGCHPKNNW